MKKLILFLIAIIAVSISASAQYKKDGTPDMRYSRNTQLYGTSSSSSYSNSNTNSGVRYQSGYTKSDGTYVEPHMKTNTNETNHDNFSTKDNYNYYNNSNGSRAKDYSKKAKNYGRGKTIYKGSKGGQYYYNVKGKKVYVPKQPY